MRHNSSNIDAQRENPRRVTGSTAALAIFAALVGGGAVKTYDSAFPGPFEASSIKATAVHIEKSGGIPTFATLNVEVATLGRVSVGNMEHEVVDRIISHSLVGYQNPPGVYAYRPSCSDIAGKLPDVQSDAETLECGFILWDKHGPPPADN